MLRSAVLSSSMLTIVAHFGGSTFASGRSALSPATEVYVAQKSKVELKLIGRLPRKPGGSVGHLALQGKHLYLVSPDAGLEIVDISNPAKPAVVGTHRSEAELGTVAVSGNHVYVVEADNFVRVLDVSEPARIRAIGTSNFPDAIRGLDVSGQFVYVSTSEALHVLDVSDPTKPRRRGSCKNLELAGRVTVESNCAHVAADMNGMWMIDVSKPDLPRKLGSFEGPGNVTKIARAGDHAYIADYTGGLHIVDVSNPKKPRQIGEFGDFVVGDVAITGRYALLAAGGLFVVDVSLPDHPREVGGFSAEDTDTAWSVAALGDDVYTLSDAGLFIFRLTTVIAP
jgi:hypothetical protein